MPSFRSRIADVVHAGGALFRGNPLDNPAVPLSQPAAWMYDLFGSGPTASGVTVNRTTAMQHATVYSCINVLASDFSSLPAIVYERTGKGKEPAIDSDLYDLIGVQPNPDMSSVTFWGAMMACAAFTGNAYAEIQWDADRPAVPIALWPLIPGAVKPQRNTQNLLEYAVTINGSTRIVPAKSMLHVPALTLDGWIGIDPLTAARQAIGTGLAAARHIGGFFGRGSRPSGVLTRPVAPAQTGTMPTKAPEATDNVREGWERANGGESQGRTAVLPAGWTWTAISLSPEQSQHMQVMGYTRTELAGLWQVPPHRVGDTSRLSNSNHESSAREYVTFTLRPWIMRFEAEIQRKLMPRIGRKANKFSVRFDTTEFVRGDFASQIAAVAMGRQWGIYNGNEGRAKLGDGPIDGPAGSEYLVPLNMVPASRLLDEPAPDPNNDDGGQQPTPRGNGGQNQRMLLSRMANAYRGLFRDAAGRLQARSVRDTAAVQQVFGPVLGAIAGEAQRQARSLNRLGEDVDLGADKILRDAAKSIEKRASTWTETTVEDEAALELDRTVRAITLNIFREAGSVLAQAA